MPYADIHTHLTHARFAQDWQEVVARAINVGIEAIVTNGTDPASNRICLAMAEQFSVIKPALGIYPVDAVNSMLPSDYAYPVERFDVDEEIRFIESCAASKKIIAVGECGLDGYAVEQNTFAEQERVFEALIDIAIRHDIPVIVHSRKLEERTAEVLAGLGAKKVNMHCYSGRTRNAQALAEKHGWCFSIPANARRNGAFAKMLAILPLECILTETDAPYLPSQPGERNEPSAVVGTVDFFAEIRGISVESAKEIVWNNFVRLTS